MFTTQEQIREAFWRAYPTASRETVKGYYPTMYVVDTRIKFADFLDHLGRAGLISTELAETITL